MTSTETRPLTIAERRRDFVERQILRAAADQSGVEWFEQLHSIRARAAQLGGSAKWDRVARFIDSRLNEGTVPLSTIVILALARYKEAVDFPRV